MTISVTKHPWLPTAVLLILGPVNAQTITYNFTGTVNWTGGICSGIAVGTPINGTYSFNFSYGQSEGTSSLGAPTR